MYISTIYIILLLFIIVFLVVVCFWLFRKSNQSDFEFTSIVNHVFRTPLTRIMWITKELEKNISQEEKFIYLQNLENATTRVLDIVDIIAGIKSVGNKEGYFFQAVHIREIIEKSISKYRESINKKNISFNLENFKDIPMLTVDIKKISFLIDVLMENAISYTPINGTIGIGADVRRNTLVLSISDSGIGLDRKDKRKLFSKFYRGKNAKLMYTDGMGLGLYLSKVIVKRHNGKLYAKSQGRNKGTTFFLELPFIEK